MLSPYNKSCPFMSLTDTDFSGDCTEGTGTWLDRRIQEVRIRICMQQQLIKREDVNLKENKKVCTGRLGG